MGEMIAGMIDLDTSLESSENCKKIFMNKDYFTHEHGLLLCNKETRILSLQNIFYLYCILQNVINEFTAIIDNI